MQNTIKTAFGVPVVQQYEKYLGLPSFIGRRKKESFDNIKQRVWKKLQGWEGKLLSQAGREILIKAVAQALPTYAMLCFKLPIELCHEIETLVKKNWGGKKERAKRSIGKSGRSFANQRHKGGWVSKIFQDSTMHYSQSKLGDSCRIKHHCFIEFSKPSIFPTAQSWKPQVRTQPHMHGKA